MTSQTRDTVSLDTGELTIPRASYSERDIRRSSVYERLVEMILYACRVRHGTRAADRVDWQRERGGGERERGVVCVKREHGGKLSWLE